MKITLILLLLSVFTAAGISLPTSFSADFSQKVTNTKGGVIYYSGKIYFNNTNRLKWSYLKPSRKEVCSNPDTLVVVDHDLEQISSYSLFKTIDIIDIFKRAKPYKKYIYTTKIEGTTYTIQLDKSGKLHSLAYHDKMEHKVQIVFKKVQYNTTLLEAVTLQCDMPKAYDKL